MQKEFISLMAGQGQDGIYVSPGICKMSRGQELLQLSDLQDVLETATWQICRLEWNANLLAWLMLFTL